MKRLLCILVILIFSVPVFAAEISAVSRQEVLVYLEDEKIEFDNPPVISGGRILAPVRRISEALGAEISWNDQSKTAKILSSDRSISFCIGQKTMVINGDETEIDVAAEIIGGRTFVPMRALAEALEFEVEWFDDTKTAFLSLKKPLGKDYKIPVTYYVKSGADEGCVIACKTMVLSNFFNREYSFEEVLEKNGGGVYANWGEQFCEGVSWRIIMGNELPLKEEEENWEKSEYSVREKLFMIANNLENSSGIIAQFAKDCKTHGVVITGYTAEGEIIVCDPDTNSDNPENTLIKDSCLAKMFGIYTTEELLLYLTSMRMIEN